MKIVEVNKTATLSGHKDCIYTLEWGRSSNNFFSAGGDGMVVSWDLRAPEQGTMIAKVPNSVYALHYIPNRQQLLVGQNFQGVHLIDIENKKELFSAKVTDSYIFDIKTSDKNIYLVCGDGNLIVLNKEDLTLVSKTKLSEKSGRSIAINPFYGIYAIGFSDFSIKIFSFEKNQLLFNINAHQNSIFTLAFSPDGRYLLSGSRDAHLKVWDCEKEFSMHKSIVAHMFAINHIQYNNEGDFFATCSMDKSIKLWDSKDFRLLKVIDKARHAGHGTSVNKLLWKETETLISAGDDKTIAVWDLKFSINHEDYTNRN